MGSHRWYRELLVPLGVFAVVVVTKLWLESSELGIWPLVFAAALVAGIDLVAEAHLSCAVFFFSSGLQMALAMLLGGFGLGLMLVRYTPPEVVPLIASTPAFLVVGVLVGIGVRNRFVASCERRRSGDSTHDVRLHLAIAVGMIVVLFPPSDSHASLGPSYVIGIGLGFFLHFLMRRADQRALRYRRLRRTIEQSLERPGVRSEAVEIDAIRLFSRRRWRALRELFRERAASPSFDLILLKAAAERVQGEDLRAIGTLTPALEKHGREGTELDHLAHLLLAMCYRELGRTEEMWLQIANAERLQQRCLLRSMFKALCLAEELPDPGHPNWSRHEERRHEANVCLDEALALLRGTRRVSPFASVVACGLPLTRRFVDDTFAYVSMKSGALEPSHTLFEACLRQDSRSAASHLHLAECNFLLSDAARSRGEGDLAERTDRAGDFCVKMALALSEKRAGQTSRRARALLEARRWRGTTGRVLPEEEA